MTTVNPEVAAIVLCGGGSTRMGFDKARLTFGNESFLERIIRTVTPFVSAVVVAGTAREACEFLPSDIRDSVIFAPDQNPDSGPMEGIRAGLDAIGGKAEVAFVTSCDVPLIKGEVVNVLMRHLEIFDAVVPVRDSRIFGLTALYRVSVCEQVSEMVDRRRLKVALLADELNANRIPIEALCSVDPDLDSITNINSLEDYEQLLKRFSFSVPEEIRRRIKS